MSSFNCSNCDTPLERVDVDHGVMWVCRSCGGRAAGIGVLMRALDKRFVDTLWIAAEERPGGRGPGCPACRNPMTSISTTSVPLDVCKACRFIWFDPGEYAQVPVPASFGQERPSLTQDQLEAVGRIQAEEIALQWRDKPDVEVADQLAMIPGVLGMPIEEEAPSLQRNPWVTWLLGITLCLVMSATAFAAVDLAREYGLIPSDAFRFGGLTFVTSFFVHSGLFHLLSNVYFLMVFGDNVEDFLRRGAFAMLLVVAALVGAGVHALFSPERDLPLVGASAGISGVIVFYGLRFPQAKLRYFRLYRWFSMPAIAATGFWVLTQVVGARDQLAGEQGVSFLAHLGGGVVGLWFWFLWRND